MLRRLRDDGLSWNTIVRVRSVLSMAIRWAQRRDLVNRNVAQIAEIPANTRRPKRGRSLTEEEAKALLAAGADHRLGPLVTVSLMLGLRPGEVTGLRWDDIDFEKRTLAVTQSRKRETGDDGTEKLTFGPPKTLKSVRTIEVPAPVYDALVRQRARRDDERRAAEPRWQEHGLVFATTVGTPMGPNNLRRDFNDLTAKAGIGHWTPNELRHSAGSLLSAAGVPLEQIADLLGHVDTRMLERVYRHPVRPTVSAAVAPMERMFEDMRDQSAQEKRL
jgi:integrase